jgi:hypothetical protein
MRGFFPFGKLRVRVTWVWDAEKATAKNNSGSYAFGEG